MKKRPTDHLTVAGRVRFAREEKGYSQKILAIRAGISQTTVADLERGRNAGSKKLPEIARATGVNAIWLATGRGDPFAALPAREQLGPAAEEMVREMGDRIRKLRVAARMTPAHLGRAIGGAAVIREIEAGEVWPDPVALDDIATRLQTSLDWLVRGLYVDILITEAPHPELARTIHELPPGGWRKEV